MIQKTGVSLSYASLAEKTQTPPRKFSLVVFSVGNSLRKPPSGREVARRSRDGRSLRNFGFRLTSL
jgi:hypothetical protein